MNRSIFFLVAIALSGCSSVAISPNEAAAVPSEHIYDKSLLLPDSTKENITFIRDMGFLGIGGAGCSKTIYINNVKSFELQQGQAITVSLLPGNYFVRLSSGAGVCPNVEKSENVQLVKGSAQTFRIIISQNGETLFARIK